MAGLSVSTQRVIMKSLSSRRLQTSDYWEYAVSRSWLESWDNCISHSLSLEYDTGFTDSGCVSKPVTMSPDDADNVYIPESQWLIYLSMFGIASDHELRRRPIYSLYSSIDPDGNVYGEHVIADKELDFLPILVADVNDIAAGNQIQQQMSVYAWDSLTYVGKQAKTKLGLKRNVHVRLWVCIYPTNQSQDTVIEPVMNETQPFLCKLIELVPNIKALMKQRSIQINPKYIIRGREENLKERSPLWEDVALLLSAHSPCIAIGVERIGINVRKSGLAGIPTAEELDDENLESIVMISSIQNEWEDILTTFVEKYAEDMSGNIEALKEKLIDSAKSIVGEKLQEISDIREDFEKRFSMLEERENAVRTKENENNEKEADIAKRLLNFKRGLEDFQKQKKKFADEIERIETQNKISHSRVTLNIGGIMYTTSVETLTKEEGSLLAMMFGGRHAVTREPDGTYFIDRDGVNFRYILNYLRDGTDSVEALPKEGKLIKELKIEAKYYGLTGLETLLQNVL